MAAGEASETQRRRGTAIGGVIGLVVILALFLAYCSDDTDATSRTPQFGADPITADTEPVDGVADRVRAVLAGNGYEPINVIVDGDTVILSGSVASSALKAQLGSLVATVGGVGVVRNQLEVPPPPAAAGDTDNGMSAGDGSDAEADEPLESPEMAADIVEGIVTLRGRVASDEVKTLVVAGAEAGFGAGNVVDQLTVGPRIADEPWVIGFARFLTFAEVTDLRVGAAGGSVTLEGEVREDEIANNLVALAGDETGLDVVDRLTIAGLSDEDLAEAQDALNETLALTNINFETNSAIITDDSFAILDEVVAILTEGADLNVVIEGHTDSQGAADANRELSLDRAQAVIDYLVASGIAADRLSAIGLGEDEPIADNSTAAGRAENRRIEFVVAGG